MIVYHDLKQGSPEWWLCRKGIPTASNFSRIITAKTLKPSAEAEGFICELIADLHRLTVPDGTENYTSRAMQNGIDTEAEARRWYEMEASQDVVQVGFCTTDDHRFGCSPDGLVGEDGGLELKCPLAKTHVKYLLDGHLPDEYRAQVHGSLIVTGRAWWDFASYAPGLPPLLIRVIPNEYTETLRVALEAFWTRYQDTLKAFRLRSSPAAEEAA